MTHLVYHNLPEKTAQASPFDEAVLEVARFGSVDIVSPYIGVDYLFRIIQVSQGWRLITDIEAWLSSLSIRARPKAWLFIRENLKSIHHCPAIHAKAVISEKRAMFGSANLTNAGILGRTELGILFDDTKMLAELSRWFNTLWVQTNSPIADETSAFIQWLDDEVKRAPARREKFSLSASSWKIRARLVKLPSTALLDRQSENINLETIAQTLIEHEQLHCDTLKEALESAIDSLADSGFVFRQIVQSIRLKFASSTVREIYFGLIQYCTNHVRSVFSENTKNRLILTSGRFIQSSQELIAQAVSPYDLFLVNVVSHFDFTQAREMPIDDFSHDLTGIRSGDQLILISDLLDCGFLEIKDVAGRLPQYTLLEDFEWSGRYKLFVSAMTDWHAKLRLASFHKKKTSDQIFDVAPNFEFGPNEIENFLPDEDSSIEENLNVNGVTLSAFLFAEKEKMQKDEISRAESATIKRKTRRSAIDSILAHLLLEILSGKTQSVVLTGEAMLKIPMQLGVSSTLLKAVLRGEDADIPHVIKVTKKTATINQNLNWNDLDDYPLTHGVCKSFLDT